MYRGYLSAYSGHLDEATTLLTEQIASLFSLRLPEISTTYCDACLKSEVYYYDYLIVTLIEGCNGLSVMILFVAFLVAFKGPVKHYLWFVPVGLALIYVANLLRIFLLGIINIYWYSFSGYFHDYFFPAIIYGMVMILWIIWVKWLAGEK